ncbi:MAG: hypothetical protein HS109_15590 [Burkholderiales bacterium]|nr:hypothetical protein [Burkholderiales bacterium]
MTLVALRRLLGVAGITLLGGALALAPVLAFTGGMTIVSGAGLAGVALLIAMRLLPRPPAADPEPDEGKQERQ